MKPHEILFRLTDLFRAAFDRPDLIYHGKTMMRDIPGFDSINFVQMILAVEEAFGIELHEDEVDTICTMSDVYARVRDKVPRTD